MKKYIFLLIFFLLFFNIKCSKLEKPFVIVIPSYNNKYWYQKNLDSVFRQNYTNYRVIYIDDISSDKTGELVEQYIIERKQTHRTNLIKNTTRKLALANLYDAIHSCKPEEIIVCLDGDDMLAHESVLSYLNNIYQNANTWLTYGQYKWYPYSKDGDWGCIELPDYVIENNLFRESRYCTSHLRTFYASLFHKIKKEDLLYEGKFFPMTGDLAMMFPLIEMAGYHSKFISDTLYIYNDASIINDYKTNPTLQITLDHYIRSQPKYQKLEKLFD
ncbi:MAG: glycosyltransferase [Candidatus Babeliales bacterium]|nr:glycosyltransferase [Candidatus Babeliales bacterium]